MLEFIRRFIKKVKTGKNIFFIAVFALFINSFFFIKNFKGFESDGFLYAEVARNVAEGRGFTTSIIYPYEFDSIKSLNHPYFGSGPLHPVLISLLFLVFGAHEWAVVLLGSIFFILIAVFIYLLGKKAFDERVGILASLLFITDTNMLRISINGMVEATYAFFILAAIYFFYKARSKLGFLIAGIFLGLCQLTRQNTFFFLWVFLFYIIAFNKNKSPGYLAAFSLGYIAFSLPEFLRLYICTGKLVDPVYQYAFFYNTALGSPSGCSIDILRMIHPPYMSPPQYIFRHITEFLKRCVSNLNDIYKEFLFLINPYKMSFFFVGCFERKNSESGGLKFLIYGVIATQLVISVFFYFWIRYYLPFVPLILLLISEFLVYLFNNLLIAIRRIKIVFCVFLAALFLAAPLTQFISGIPGITEKSFFSKNARNDLKGFILKNTQPQSFIVTDLFEVVSWETQRPAMWLPLYADSLKEIDKKFPISYILLTSEERANISKEWNDFFLGAKKIEGFKLKDVFVNGFLRAVLFEKENSI